MEESQVRPSTGPQVVFRGLIPLEHIVSLAHEQDALLREIFPCASVAETEVCLEQPSGLGRGPVRAKVQARFQGDVAHGCAQHADASAATRLAYSELMRALARSTPPPSADFRGRQSAHERDAPWAAAR